MVVGSFVLVGIRNVVGRVGVGFVVVGAVFFVGVEPVGVVGLLVADVEVSGVFAVFVVCGWGGGRGFAVVVGPLCGVAGNLGVLLWFARLFVSVCEVVVSVVLCLFVLGPKLSFPFLSELGWPGGT